MKMNIKDIVEQVQETPSPRCWESISSQLPTAGTAIGGGAAATAAKGTIVAGKIAAIVGSTAAVVAIVTGTTIAILKHEPAIEQQTVNQPNTTITIADSTVTEDINTENTSLLCQTETEQNVPAKGKPVATAEKPNNEEAHVVPQTPIIQAPTASSSPVTYSPSTTTPASFSNPTPSSNSVSTPNSASVPSSNSDKTTNNSGTYAQTSNTGSDNKIIQENNANEAAQAEEWSFSKPVMIEIPNFFSPNGDGANDQFVINGLDNCEKKMLIVKDRSGQIVFQSRNYDNSWDGGNLPDGTYYYQFSYSINNINELRQGTILLRR